MKYAPAEDDFEEHTISLPFEALRAIASTRTGLELSEENIPNELFSGAAAGLEEKLVVA